MLTREQALRNITYALGHLATTVQLLAGNRFFDLNVVAEDFYAGLLNASYGWNLQNLNHQNLNSAAVDLGDAGRQLAVQVTSERRKDKVQGTLDKFVAHGLAASYTALKVVIIGDRTGDYPGLNVPAGVTFSGKNDVIDHADLLGHIRTLTTPQVVQIASYIAQEVHPHPWVVAVQGQTDLEALRVIRGYFDRPAMQDPWQAEYNFSAFGSALTELIGLLNAGKVGPNEVSKRRSAFQDPQHAAGLDAVYRKLLSLRQLYQTHVRSGEIDEAANRCQFRIAGTEQTFDTLRRGVLDELNQILGRAGLPNVPGV